MSLEKTRHELEATAQQVASIAFELNAVAKDLNDYGVFTTAVETSKWREHLRLRAIGLQAEAGRLALAALSARAAAEQIACASTEGSPNG